MFYWALCIKCHVTVYFSSNVMFILQLTSNVTISTSPPIPSTSSPKRLLVSEAAYHCFSAPPVAFSSKSPGAYHLPIPTNLPQ